MDNAEKEETADDLLKKKEKVKEMNVRHLHHIRVKTAKAD